MIRQLTTSYENMGTSSYLTVTFTGNVQMVHYQMEMITSNEIDHVLSVSKRMVNGENVAYYNITSKIALSQILERKKLSRKEFMKLVEGAIRATRDAGEYQLPASGLVMDPEFIFVDPANCNPGFLFLPTANSNGKTLRDLILELIMQGKLELSNDNFIQVLLEAVNSQPLSLDKLEACIAEYKGGKSSSMQTAPKPTGTVGGLGTPETIRVMEPVPVAVPAPVSQEGKVKTAGEIPEKSAGDSTLPNLPGKKVPAPNKEKKIKEKPVKEKKTKEKAEAGPDAEAAKKKFLLPQALILVLLAAAYSFGVFVDAETGGISVTNIAAVVGCVALVEFVLYREAFVNGKDSKEKKEKAGKAVKTSKTPTGPKVPEAPKGLKTPKASNESKIPKAPAKAVELSRPSFPGMKKTEDAMSTYHAPASAPTPTPVYTAPSQIQVPTYSSDTIIEGETEIWDGGQSGMSSYLEYYENGMMSRIPLDKSSTLLGRLSGQVDFAVSNPKVGKVHAEIINQNGQIFIKDLSSKNGTYMNGSTSRINSNVLHPLNVNDRFKLADSEFTLRQS